MFALKCSPGKAFWDITMWLKSSIERMSLVRGRSRYLLRARDGRKSHAVYTEFNFIRGW